MRAGLALPHYDFSSPDGTPATWEALAGWARRAEDLGFDSVWVSDHFFLSLARYGGREEPFGTPEPLTALAGLAVVTERVRLGTLVLGAGFRHPSLVVKAATTIDLLSRGRLDLGIGAGWYEDEYRAFGYDFEDPGARFDVLEECLVVMDHLFGEGPTTWEGERFRLDGAFNRPPPAQEPRPPVWVGGKGGPRLLRLVARHGDGWNSVWAWAPDAYADRVRALRGACEREDRDPGSVRLSLGLSLLLGEDETDLRRRLELYRERTPGGLVDPGSLEDWRARRLAGTPEEVVERLAAFAELGVEEVIVSPGAVPFAVHDPEAVEAFAERVAPEIRRL